MKKESAQRIKVSSSEWKHATEELLSLSGIGTSGFSDLASKHDDYLEGKVKDKHFKQASFGFIRVP